MTSPKIEALADVMTVLGAAGACAAIEEMGQMGEWTGDELEAAAERAAEMVATVEEQKQLLADLQSIIG